MKQLLFIFILTATLSACRKQGTNFLIVKGRVIDAYSKQPIAGYPVQIGYIASSQGMGFNLGNWSNISSCNTDSKGYFTLTTPYALSKDTTDYYKVDALSFQNYSGFGRQLNAKQAETQRNITLGDVEVDKLVTLNLTVHHTSPMNSNDFILGNVASASFYYYGNDSIKEDKFWVVFNKPAIIEWNYSKNNIYYGPFTDTVILTNPENTYLITY